MADYLMSSGFLERQPYFARAPSARVAFARRKRELDAKHLDQLAAAAAQEWKRFRRAVPDGSLADFARALDQSLPVKIDDYWDDPVYQTLNYLLTRAGVITVGREDAALQEEPEHLIVTKGQTPRRRNDQSPMSNQNRARKKK